MLKFLTTAAKAAGLAYQTLATGVMIGALLHGDYKQAGKAKGQAEAGAG